MPNSILDVASARPAAIEKIDASTGTQDTRAQSATSIDEQQPAPADATNLSPLSNFLGAAIRGAQSQSPVRPDVVAQIRAQLAAGTYQPDKTAVAASVYRALKANQ